MSPPRLARRMQRVTPSAIMELIKATAGKPLISFASGLPDPSLFPVAEIADVTASVLNRDGAGALQYGPAEGHPPLRELVAEQLTARGLSSRPDQILITNGSQQALDLAARAVLDPGETVGIERPTYLAALQTFDSYEADYRAFPVDADGLIPPTGSALSGVRLLYLLPNFQNPTGRSLAEHRRRPLAENCATAACAVLEDDAYHDLWYDSPPPPPVCGLAANPLAVYTGTFSKTMAPGVRVGYLRAEADLVDRLGQLKQITDLHSGSLTQRVVVEYCRRGLLQPGIERFRTAYRTRRDLMLGLMADQLTGLAEWDRPGGGMFIWLTLPEGLDCTALLRTAMERGIAFVPGASFHPGGGGENTLRLNFVSPSEDAIQRGVPILASVIREALDA